MKMLHMKLMLSATVLALMTTKETLAQELVLNPASFNRAENFSLQIPPEQQNFLNIEPLGRSSGIQLAGICFLPDCNLGLPSYDDVNSDTKWCEDHGYYFTCPDGTGADYSQRCYRDESYTKEVLSGRKLY